MVDRIEGLRAKHAQKVSGFIPQLSMRICVQSAQQRFWLVCFKVQRETRSSRSAWPRHALYHAAWIPTHWSGIPLMFIYVHTFRTVCLSVLVFEHPRGNHVKIRGLLWNQFSFACACSYGKMTISLSGMGESVSVEAGGQLSYREALNALHVMIMSTCLYFYVCIIYMADLIIVLFKI